MVIRLLDEPQRSAAVGLQSVRTAATRSARLVLLVNCTTGMCMSTDLQGRNSPKNPRSFCIRTETDQKLGEVRLPMLNKRISGRLLQDRPV